MVACGENDDKLLEHHLNQPRNPNFEDANAKTPLCAASLNGSLKCVSLLIEAGANKDQGKHRYWSNASLHRSSPMGTLKLSDFWLSPVPTKTKGRTDTGATPLSKAAENGHLEVVRFLVESGANKDQGTTDNGATPLFS